MGFTLAIWLGCEDTSFPFTYVFIIHFFILFVKTYSHLTFHTLIFPLYQQAERNFSLRLFRLLKVINTAFNFEYPQNIYLRELFLSYTIKYCRHHKVKLLRAIHRIFILYFLNKITWRY